MVPAVAVYPSRRRFAKADDRRWAAAFL